MKNKFLFGLILIAIGYSIGLISYKYQLFTIKHIQSANQYCQDYFAPPQSSSLKETNDTISLSQFDNSEFTVIFTFGQSNSASYGQTTHECQEEVYNWHNGIIYKAKDPLKGVGSYKGSVWTRLADKMIVQGISKKILLVPICIGGTKISQWANNGRYHKTIEQTINNLKLNEIEIDLILWHQGESDNIQNTTTNEYVSDFETIRKTFRINEINAPIFIAIASYYPTENALMKKQLGCDSLIQNAQYKLIEKHSDIYLGANTDNLDKIYDRHDGIHFSAIGLEKHADLWIEKLIKSTY